MLRYPITHPPLLSALGAAGHGSRILLADGNYPHSTSIGPRAALVHLNLRPGLVAVDQVLEPLLETVPVEAAAVMVPDDGSTPEVFARYRELLGAVYAGMELQPLGRWEFYRACLEPDVAVAVATGDQRLYADLLLTVGVVPPA
jgi:L-fucose mutarotase